MTATLSAGEASIDPSSTPLPADAEFTYTASSKDGVGGTASFEARSKRGVGKAKIDFMTSALQTVTITGALTFSLVGAVGTANFDLTMVPDPAGAYTGTAELRMSATINRMATTCDSAAWTESLDLMGTLSSQDGQPVLLISTIGEAPRGDPVAMSCTTGGVTVQSQTPFLSSSVIGETQVQLVDGDQPFVDTISTATGTLTVTLS